MGKVILGPKTQATPIALLILRSGAVFGLPGSWLVSFVTYPFYPAPPDHFAGFNLVFLLSGHLLGVMAVCAWALVATSPALVHSWRNPESSQSNSRERRPCLVAGRD
jgi:hypothetical protein